MLLHDLQELDDNLGRRSNQNLSLTGLFSVVDSVQGVSQNRGSSHNSEQLVKRAQSNKTESSMSVLEWKESWAKDSKLSQNNPRYLVSLFRKPSEWKASWDANCYENSPKSQDSQTIVLPIVRDGNPLALLMQKLAVHTIWSRRRSTKSEQECEKFSLFTHNVDTARTFLMYRSTFYFS